jgi:hypothetical protein
MDPVDQTPTARSDYALLSAGYMGLVAALAASARGRRGAPLGGKDILPLSAATFAVSKMVVHEKVETWMRAPFVEEHPDGKRPRGRRLRYVIGELLTCTRCTGAWSALALVALRTHAPETGRLVTTVLATSAGNDFLHAGFSYLCETTNRTEHEVSTLRDSGEVEDTSADAGGRPRVVVTAR